MTGSQEGRSQRSSIGIKIMFVGSHVVVQLVKDGEMDEIREVLEQSDPAWNPPS